MAARLISSASTTATARRGPSNRPAAWSSKMGSPSFSTALARRRTLRSGNISTTTRCRNCSSPAALRCSQTLSTFPGPWASSRTFGRRRVSTPGASWRPEAKIGVLYQNDSFGKDYLIGLKDGLGPDHAGKVIKEASYETYEPTVDSQIATLQGSGADVLLIAAIDRFAAQAIRRAFDLDWTPTRYLAYPSRSVVAVMKPAGLEKSKGVISANFAKDPTDARWKDDPGMKEWQAFCAKYLTQTDLIDANAANGFTYGAMLVRVLKQCGADLSRENIMRQAANLRDIELPLLLPGVKVNTSPTNYSPIRQMQLATFNGESWELFGEILEA